MGQEALGGGCKRVGRVGVSWVVGGWCIVYIGKVVENIQMGDVNYEVQWDMIN